MFTRFLSKSLKSTAPKSSKSPPIRLLTTPLVIRCFSEARVYGGLKDEDRIFVNIYGDGDVGLEGAKNRVSFHPKLGSADMVIWTFGLV